MSDTEEKPAVEEDRVSEMEDELPVCCFAFDLICCPQRYWNISKRPGEAEEEPSEEIEGEMVVEEEDEEKK